MLTENGLQVDLEAVGEVLRRADVLTIGFTLFTERLFMDTRTRPGEGPFVAIVDPVATVQERYLWLGQHRPNFGAPSGFSFFVWPHTLADLLDRDVLQPMRARLAAAAPEAAQALYDRLAELTVLERKATLAAVRGDEPWQTLWPRLG